MSHDRLRKWLDEIASTQEHEIDCVALEQAIERLVFIADRGEDIRAFLPEVAVHLEHCPECGGWYETLVEIARDLD